LSWPWFFWVVLAGIPTHNQGDLLSLLTTRYAFCATGARISTSRVFFQAPVEKLREFFRQEVRAKLRAVAALNNVTAEIFSTIDVPPRECQYVRPENAAR
jgi:hypothetical protein